MYIIYIQYYNIIIIIYIHDTNIIYIHMYIYIINVYIYMIIFDSAKPRVFICFLLMAFCRAEFSSWP